MGLGRVYWRLFRRCVERSWKRKVLLVWLRNGLCRCYHLSCVRAPKAVAGKVILRFVKTEGSLDLVIANLAGNLGDVFVESTAHISIITEYESPFNVKATRNDIFCVLSRELASLVWFKLVLK